MWEARLTQLFKIGCQKTVGHVNEIIVHINKKIGHIKKSIQ